MTTAGASTPYPTGDGTDPQEVAGGLNGQVGYTAAGLDPDLVGLITPPGPPLGVPVPATDAFGIAFGLDQAYWVANFLSNDLTRLTSTGQTSMLGLSAGSGPRHVAASFQGTLWVGLETARRIALVTGLEAPQPPVVPPANPPVTPPTQPVPPGQRPILTNVSVPRSATVGRTVRVRLAVADADTVRVLVHRKASGKRRGRRCVAPTRALRRARRCTRLVLRQTISAPVRNGIARATLSKRLAAGSYRVTLSASNADGTTTITRSLTIKPRPRRRARR